MPARLSRPAQLLIFALAFLVSSVVREGDSVAQAIVWLPTGIAIAGLWTLGYGAWWVVAVATVVQRMSLGYSFGVIAPAVVGSTAEALVGAMLLRRLGLRGDFARLRDVLVLCVAAGVAPLVSILISSIGRDLPGVFRDPGFQASWAGWWRMNALGALTVVPLALTWLSTPWTRPRARSIGEATAIAAAILGILWVVMTMVPPGPTSIMLLYGVLPVALFAAIRFGPRGAVSAAALGALSVSMLSSQGIGSFLGIDRDARHVPIQIFGLTMVAVPLVFGSLIAEREASVSRWLRSEGLRQALLKVLPDTTCRLGADGTILDVFAPAGVLSPFARDAVVGRTLSEVVPEDVANRMLAGIAAAHRGARPEPVEFPLITPTGERMFEARYVGLAEGEVLNVVRDITERKYAERVLAWEAEILGLITQGGPTVEVLSALVRGVETLHPGVLCTILQLQGRRLYLACASSLASTYTAAIDGWEVDPDRGCCGSNRTVVVTDIATDPLWAEVKELRDLALRHDLRACWTVPVRSSGGEVLGTLAAYARQPRAPAPAELAVVERSAVLAGIAIDRERREHLLASINRNVTQALYRSVPERGLVYVNQAFAGMFGYVSPEELLSGAASAAGDPAHRADLQQLIVGDGLPTEAEVALHRRDGSVFWALISSTAVCTPGGRVMHHDGTITDVTTHRQLEEQLRQAQKMEAVGKLAGGVAHDFNNLLTAISGYAETIREAVAPTSDVRAHVVEILRAVERAARLTHQLLAFSRQQVLTPQVLDLPLVVEQLSGMLRRLIGEDIGLVTLHGPEPECVLVDRGQLEQVIVNLVVNARDAMPSGGTLTIRTAVVEVDQVLASTQAGLSPGPYVALSVQDTGIGMDPDVQARAFDPFFSTKAPGRGTGLGLASVYGIVKQSGGAVWIESVPGRGTTVWIYLARVAAAAQVPAPSLESLPAPVSATVLLVEDEELVRELLELALTSAGHVVLAAEDGRAALELARRHRGEIDLLITDVIMPRMGGRDLAGRLAAERPGTPVLFVSGYASDGRDRITSDLGGEFLQKPFAPSVLRHRIATILASRARVPGK